MKEKAPAFQWYPKDCDTDEVVKAMSDEEFGFYMRLLNHSWLNRGVPGEMDELARVMGRTLETVVRLWERVGRKFRLRRGRFYNPKQECQRNSAKTLSQQRTFAARVGSQKRRLTNEIQAHAQQLRCSPSASASASATTTEKKTPPTVPPSGGDVPLDPIPKPKRPVEKMAQWKQQKFGEFWGIVWNRTGKDAAARVYERVANTPEEADFINTAAKIQGPGIVQHAADNNHSVLTPRTWLNQGRYDDEGQVIQPIEEEPY